MSLLHIEARGEGWPLVLLPPLSIDRNVMAEAIEPAVCSQKQWRRLYIDLPGTGRSRAGEPRSDVVLDENVESLRTELHGEPFVVSGWSYGGYLAAGLARRMPGQVSGLMMICSGFVISPQHRKAMPCQVVYDVDHVIH